MLDPLPKKTVLKAFDKKGSIPPVGIGLLLLFVFFFFLSPNSSASDKKKKKEEHFSSILSYFQQKGEIKSSASLVLSDSKTWLETIKQQPDDFLSALSNVYIQKKLDHFYVVSEKKLKSAKDSLKFNLPGVNKKNLTLEIPHRNLQFLYSAKNQMLYRYRGEIRPLLVPKTDTIKKNIDWVKWKLIDAMLPVRTHKNKKTYLTGNSSLEFIVKNSFSYFFVSKDAVRTECADKSLLVLLYAQKANGPPEQSINSCMVSLYIVDQNRKMEVLNMVEITPNLEKPQVDKDGWLLRAQIVQIPRRAQGVGFVVRSAISFLLDDVVLLVFPGDSPH